MTLNDLKNGDKAIIKDFVSISESNLKRINSMGINIGSLIYMDENIVNTSYNLSFICDDIQFCLRRNDCKHILVEKV